MIEIGSRDAAAIMGVSPFKTPWRCYAEKVGLLPEDTTETEVMAWGTALEPVLADHFILTLRARGLEVEPTLLSGEGTTRHRWDWCRATPDAYLYVDGEPSLLELKCTVDHAPKQPRVDWLVQCLHHRLVFPEVQHVYLVAFGGLHMEWWDIPYHDAASSRLLHEEQKFLDRIEKHDPPPVLAADASVLAKAWPITTPEPVALDVAASEWAHTLSDARKWEAHWKKTGELAEAQLKQAMAAHEKGTLPDGGVVKWKPYQREAYIVPQTTIRPLLVTLGKEDKE